VQSLFCSTSAGKIAMARQLEAGVYVDCDAGTVQSLHRFVPSLLLIAPERYAQVA
jgi:hypothetical protein